MIDINQSIKDGFHDIHSFINSLNKENENINSNADLEDKEEEEEEEKKEENYSNQIHGPIKPIFDSEENKENNNYIINSISKNDGYIDNDLISDIILKVLSPMGSNENDKKHKNCENNSSSIDNKNSHNRKDESKNLKERKRFIPK